MNRIVSFSLAALMLLSGAVARAQQTDDLYLSAEELPDAVYWLTSPPAPGSSQFMHDISQYYWGQSRVIAGFHWQSDVDASRMLAAAAYARLHACPEFLNDMAAAKEEFRRIAKPDEAPFAPVCNCLKANGFCN